MNFRHWLDDHVVAHRDRIGEIHHSQSLRCGDQVRRDQINVLAIQELNRSLKHSMLLLQIQRNLDERVPTVATETKYLHVASCHKDKNESYVKLSRCASQSTTSLENPVYWTID